MPIQSNSIGLGLDTVKLGPTWVRLELGGGESALGTQWHNRLGRLETVDMNGSAGRLVELARLMSKPGEATR